MSIEAWEPVGSHDRRLALGAGERLTELNTTGVLTVADIHVARTLATTSGEGDRDVVVAAALAVRALRSGSVAVDLGAIGEAFPDLAWPEPAQWLAAVDNSVLAREGAVVVDQGLVYLQRYHHQEVQVVEDLRARAALEAPVIDEGVLAAGLERVFPGDGYAEQRAVAEVVVRSRTSVITGGPGTGKTTTVAGVLALLAEQAAAAGERPLRVGLAAPTGKAAARMKAATSEALAGILRRTPDPATKLVVEPLSDVEPMTLHRLLGWRPGSRTRFKHHRMNRLPHDVVLLDEASMLSLTHMARLLEALRPSSRLILVGDADQLVSVDAGAVLADLVAGVETLVEVGAGAPRVTAGAAATSEAVSQTVPGAASQAVSDTVSAATSAAPSAAVSEAVSQTVSAATSAAPSAAVSEAASQAVSDKAPETVPGQPLALTRLRTAHRFGRTIAALAESLRSGDAEAVVAALRAGREAGGTEVEWVDIEDPTAALRPVVIGHALRLLKAARNGDSMAAMTALGAHRLLCAHREGPFGVRTWNRQIETWLGEDTGLPFYDPFYVGRPLLVTANDYATGVLNGDTGVIVASQTPDGTAVRMAVIEGAAGAQRFAPSRLGDIETMHAMTIHKAQGSQADEITVLLPEADSLLLTRELFYTAVTRAQRRVRVVGSEAVVRAAVERRVVRASGLRQRLSGT